MATMTQLFAGVDTHIDTHTAAIVTSLGEVVATGVFPATQAGYDQLVVWLASHGAVSVVGVEGTGSYGAGLARHLLDAGFGVREVTRPNRQHRRRHGKSDTADAVGAARAVAAGTANGTPRCVTGPVEATRNLMVARRSAVKARTAVIQQIKALLVTAPTELREQLTGLTMNQLTKHVAAHDIGDICDPADAVITALVSLTTIYATLNTQIDRLTSHLDVTVTKAAPPALLAEVGVGAVVAADLIIAAGSNPHRLRSHAAFAALCGVSPVDASSGRQQRHRLNRGGDRQANAALFRAVIVRLRYHQPTREYMTKRLAEGKTKREIIRCLKRHLARRIHHHLTQTPT